MKMCYKIILIVLIFTGISRALAQWFEKNMYLCHCENTCDSNGLCDNGKCAKGWFGFKCQYQDLLTAFSISQNVDLSVLTDQIDATCNNYGDIIIIWQEPFTFSWIRMKLKDKRNIQAVQLKFIDMDHNTIPCSKYTYAFNRDESVDIGCEVKTPPIQQLTVTAGDEICSLYINGGRNMALKQATNQSSTFQTDISDYAVDGDRNNGDELKSCSHTGVGEQLPKFEVTFPRSRVYRTDVYNRNDFAYQDRLSNFTLEMLDNVTRTFIGSAENSPKKMYTLNFDFNTIANQAVIFTNHKAMITSTVETQSFLTLCEVEIYGECVPGTWGLRCEKVCSDRCPKSNCNRDTGECNEGCTEDNISPMCLIGPWFSNDSLLCHCSSHSPCNSIGECENNQCEMGWFGFKCQYQDLATIDDAKVEIDLSTSSYWLTDRDDSTCIRINNDITVTWKLRYPFSWMRIKLTNNDNIQNLRVELIVNTGPSTNPLKCENQNIKINRDQSVDIRCDIDVEIQEIKIYNVGNICSLYINGGRNMALYHSATQSSTYEENRIKFSAEKAVDGNRNSNFSRNSCSHTNSSNPHLQIHIPRSFVYRIDIFNREDVNADRLNYSTYTLIDDHIEIFSTTILKADKVFSIYPGFKKIATTIIINTTNTPFLSLCEVEVHGECAQGSYGLQCENNCNDRCYNISCNPDTGDCEYGCYGYSDPPVCHFACNETTWGRNCEINCNSSCYNNHCNRTTGACTEGCIGHSNPPTCNIECKTDFWGVNCKNVCSFRCFDPMCDHFTGACNSQGCLGYMNPPTCNLACNATTWGQNCKESCNSTCYQKQCNSKTGKCTDGCLGYRDPPDCVQTCHEGFFGLNCTRNCSTFCDTDCDNVNGFCSMCKPGYKGASCDVVCENGTYGPNCIYNCSGYCQTTCNTTSGYCSPCKPGFKGDKCDLACQHGTWGAGCGKVCNKTCLNSNCSVTTGSCTEGCIAGYQSTYCNQTCDEHHYGRNCSMNCSTSCLNQICQRETGKCKQCLPGYQGDFCIEDCTIGYFGINCSERCSPHCRNSCNHIDGKCLQGCEEGYLGENCTEICDDHTYGLNCTGNCSTNCLIKVNSNTRTCSHINGDCFNGCLGGYEGSMCSLVADDSPPVGAIVGSIIGVVIVAAVIIAAVILWRKRTSHKSKAKGSENQSLTNLHTAKSLQNDKSKDISQDFEESSLDTPYNNDDVNTSIPLHELTKFMETHHKDFFSKQFKKIPAPKNISTEIAQSEENRNKNRYKNICPYDHSRVHLKINTGKKEGDYINASYIRGFTDEATFIAAQGPNNLVINDFIRMLWEQKIKKVVMLTNLIEEGKVKCEKYWPDKDKVTYGEIEVKLAQTQTFTDYCLRIIELSKQSEITHIVTQYHFTSWPDQGIPYAPWAIIDFSEKVFSTISSDLIVVHCSAGVGRTGTFIALYNVLRQAEETGHIDFFKTLSKLREDRTLMIQTADQYEFLHIAAQAALACKGTSVTASNIRERLRHLEQREVSGLTKMKKEFQAIDKLCKDIRKAHSEDKENGDICNSTYQNTADLKINEKNRFPSIVPRNADRPYLICDSSETGDYINAVFIPSLKKRDQLILTQLPMPTTVVDFWRLVEQYKVRLAVAFEKDKLATDKTIAIHIPTTKNMILQSMPFEIKCDHFKEDELWEEQTLTLYHEKSKSDSHELMHLQCKFSDLDSRKLLTFVKKIRSYNLHADGKILFMCRNGATYSGLCCAVSLLLDRMDSDSCASVPLVVSIMKTVRPEIIPSVEQYKLLYDALERYTDVSSPYSNVDENFFPRGLKQTKVNKPTTDQTAADDESIYNNV